MRVISFTFLKNCKLKTSCYLLSRQLSSKVIPASEPSIKVLGDPNLLEFSSSWPAHEESELRAAVSRDMRVLPDFISEAEEAALLAELEPYLKRMRYEFDHWDNAIEGYRETERRQWSPANEVIVQRVKEVAFPESEPLPHAHVLDLAASGHIKPHVDSVRFCGAVIAGLCLMSTAVMRLQHCAMEHLVVDALLQRRALYIMRFVGCTRFG